MELERFKQTLRQVLILPVVACLVLAGALVWQYASSRRTNGSIQRADNRIALATRVEELVADEDTGLRGFQVTADPRLLQPFYDAQAPLQQALADLQRIARPEDRQTVASIASEHDLWVHSFAEPVVASVRAGKTTSDDALNLAGRTSVRKMRMQLEGLIHGAEGRRSGFLDQSNEQYPRIFVILFVLAIAVGLIIGLFVRDRLEDVSSAFQRSIELQRHRSEELFHSEQNLRTTLGSIADGVITCDLDSRIQIINTVAQELTGWPEEQAQGRRIEEVLRIVNETTRRPIEPPVTRVARLSRAVALTGQTILIRRDGSEIFIDDSAAPIRNEAGELTGVVMVFRDVSMERRTRNALVANEKLAVAGRLAATIAHEIHNPLDSVANLLYILQQDCKEPEAKHFLDVAQGELTRVTQISRAMLSLYRESKAPVPVNLKDLLEDLLMLMVGRFHTLGVDIRSNLPTGAVVEGFPAELRQVFTNLITNAAEATGEGGHVSVRIVLRPAASDGAGQHLEPGATVEILDDGPGIPAEIRERLFQPFFTTKGERGTGLGLWVSQGIIRKHAGLIRLESPPAGAARGTRACVYLAFKPVIDPGGD